MRLSLSSPRAGRSAWRVPCFSALLLLTGGLVGGGCQWVPKNQLTACESKSRALVEQNRAQQAEIDNLKTHSRQVEEQLALAEEDLARLEQQLGIHQRRLANFRNERIAIADSIASQVPGARPLPEDLASRLVELSDRYPSLHVDSRRGISKFDRDVLFDTGRAELRPEAKHLLDEFAELVNRPEARDLHIVICGHADDRQVAKKPTRELYADNWELSIARANAVLHFLKQAGVDEKRMAVSGFAHHQPVRPNQSPEDRQANRRVELFLSGSETPLVGWVETIPDIY